ncbi:4-alpha-glucanotransferase [Desulforhopalus sp. IMCC35007]|uniref:4-alpha-glucanotransferase n=1 Tax=Desulforhopalus sp. IMCC35007 TaxID=2569543 RepID=UPI0010ADBA31|nr:4-alpha-glucanotransferase [Desulforhopalus sp. IMCC35007]TKB11244.1 4-alpha-glucanotransferase [Desulforhopalus sp. IMCC35007]
MIPHRSSGILLHLTSLPSRYGIGDMGPSSYDFIEFLKNSEQTYWQFLPTNPTYGQFDHSPYMSNSAFAGNPLFISPDLLVSAGYLNRAEIVNVPDFSVYTTEFSKVVPFKCALLEKAFTNFQQAPPAVYQEFIKGNDWLDDYALFMVAKELYAQQGWFAWPEKIAKRDQEALTLLAKANRARIEYYYFEQFEYFRQWNLLKNQCQKNGIRLFGDLPIYVSYDSVDVWANQNLFTLDPVTLRPTHVSGVPPDYFSETGQRWGNPLYKWQSQSAEIQENLTDWWIARLAHLFTQVDVARIDHFRGFESYWAIPEENETAINGTWLKGPGIKFFHEVKSRLGQLDIIAEDLGIITQDVVKLRDDLGFPGMKILQFAFDGNPENSFLPHNYDTNNCVVYTGTHDNDTTVGWYLSDKITDQQRATVKRAANRQPNDSSPIHQDLMYLAQSSTSKLSIFPLQDVLGFGNDCKMNSPGQPTGNWRWRCSKEFFTPAVENYLAETTIRFGRNRKEHTLLQSAD